MIAPRLIEDCFRTLSYDVTECIRSALTMLIRAKADGAPFPGT